MAQRPILVFDVNETLLDLETLAPTFGAIFHDPAAMRLWFANLITYSEALTLAGVYVPFTDIGARCCGCWPLPVASRRLGLTRRS